jgi:hypothetical protein
MPIDSKNQAASKVDGAVAVAHAFSPEGARTDLRLRPNMNFPAAELIALTR